MDNAESHTPVQCKSCNKRLPAGAVVCGYCGHSLASDPAESVRLLCPSCKKSVMADSAFCGYCGAQLDRDYQTHEHSSCGSSPYGAADAITPRLGDIGTSSVSGPSPKLLAAFVLVALIVGTVFVAKRMRSTQIQSSSAGPSVAPQPVPPPSKILTKDPEFVRLLHPPQGDALLELSTEYAQKRQEIESKLAAIQDPEIRKQVSDDEWGKVDKSIYIKAEEETLTALFPSAMQACLERHRADWFEVGHVEYSGTDVLQVKSVEAALVKLPEGMNIPVTPILMDQVYSTFREVANDQIKAAVDVWMEEQSCTTKLRNVCVNLGGPQAESECSSASALEDTRIRY